MTFLLYLVTLVWIALGLTSAAPGVTGGDSPELASAAFHLGSAHAPGYPLFITLGHLFQFLPVGTPAFRLTFFSIFTQSMAFLILAQTLPDLISVNYSKNKKLFISILTSALVFSGPLVFHQMASPEVFALHLLFVCLLLRFTLFPDAKIFYLTAFMVGSALSNQHLTLLILPALGWAYRSHLKITKNIFRALCFSILGLSLYLILPLRAVQAPLVNWGNPSNFHQFLYHLSRAQYGGDITNGSFMNGFWDIYLYSSDLFLESWGIGLVFLVIGLWKRKQSYKFEYHLGGIFLFAVLPFLIRASFDPENNHVNNAFLPPAIIWFSPLILQGIVWVFETARPLRLVLLPGLGIFTIVLTGFSYNRNQASRNLAVEDVGKNILLQMPAQSVLFCEGDAVTFPLAYLQLVQKFRPDVEIFDRTGGLFRDLYHLLDYRRKPEPAQGELVAIEKKYAADQHTTAVFYSENVDIHGQVLKPYGLLFWVKTEENPNSPENIIWGKFRVPRIKLNHDYFSRETAARYYLFNAPFELDNQGNIPQGLGALEKGKNLAFDNSRLMLNAGLVESNHGLIDQAALTFDKAILLTPRNYLPWYDRGVVAEKQNHYDQAVVLFKKSIDLAPDYVESHQHLGFLYFQTQKNQEAVQEWEIVRKLDPLYAGAYRNLGYIFMRRQPDYAVQMFEHYLALTPNAPDKVDLERWLATQHK